jgi:hypothetical protein
MVSSASSRYERARSLLLRQEHNVLEEGHSVRDYEDYEDEQLRIGEAAVALLREFSSPPSIGQTEDALIAEFRDWITQNGTGPTLGTEILPADATDAERTEKRRHDLTLAFAHGLRLGIRSALETWEPDDYAPPAPREGGYLIDRIDDRTVDVTNALGETDRIDREDADPEHRFTHYRLAAAVFGNPPADADCPHTATWHATEPDDDGCEIEICKQCGHVWNNGERLVLVDDTEGSDQ